MMSLVTEGVAMANFRAFFQHKGISKITRNPNQNNRPSGCKSSSMLTMTPRS